MRVVRSREKKDVGCSAQGQDRSDKGGWWVALASREQGVHPAGPWPLRDDECGWGSVINGSLESEGDEERGGET